MSFFARVENFDRKLKTTRKSKVSLRCDPEDEAHKFLMEILDPHSAASYIPRLTENLTRFEYISKSLSNSSIARRLFRKPMLFELEMTVFYLTCRNALHYFFD
jgi:hypothetical protein